MSSSAASNQKLVLEAFDRLFNKRDYRAIECWSDGYLQHSALIAPGRDGILERAKSLPDSARYENQFAIAEDDYVVLYGRFSGIRADAMVTINVVRVENGKLAEHWDVWEKEATRAESASGLPMFGDHFPDER